jgi:hypothetical protein
MHVSVDIENAVIVSEIIDKEQIGAGFYLQNRFVKFVQVCVSIARMTAFFQRFCNLFTCLSMLRVKVKCHRRFLSSNLRTSVYGKYIDHIVA